MIGRQVASVRSRPVESRVARGTSRVRPYRAILHAKKSRGIPDSEASHIGYWMRKRDSELLVCGATRRQANVAR